MVPTSSSSLGSVDNKRFYTEQGQPLNNNPRRRFRLILPVRSRPVLDNVFQFAGSSHHLGFYVLSATLIIAEQRSGRMLDAT